MKRNIFFLCVLSALYSVSCTRVVDYSSSTSSSSSSSGSSSGSPSGSGTPPVSGGPSGPSATPLPPGSRSGGSNGTTTTISHIGFAISSTSPCAPSQEVFTFKDTTVGIPTGATYQWYFGDGNSVVGINDSIASNQYNYGGTYTVTMKIIKNNQILATYSKGITAFGQDVSPTANFYGSQSSGNNYSFNSTSSLNHGSIKQYNWDFGDGATATGNSFVKHTFPSTPYDKYYTVSLTVTSSAGCTNTYSSQFFIPAIYTLTGNFIATSTNPCAPSKEIFTFTQNLVGVLPPNPEFDWDFGDGTTGIGNPVQHEYTYGNNNNVTLYVKYNSTTIYQVTKGVAALGQNVTPTAIFQPQVTNSTGNAYSFNSQSTVPHGSIVSYNWSFGDGFTANNAFVTHTYAQTSITQNFTVSLTVTGSSGCNNTTSQIVSIPPK